MRNAYTQAVCAVCRNMRIVQTGYPFHFLCKEKPISVTVYHYCYLYWCLSLLVIGLSEHIGPTHMTLSAIKKKVTRPHSQKHEWAFVELQNTRVVTNIIMLLYRLASEKSNANKIRRYGIRGYLWETGLVVRRMTKMSL